MNNGIGQMIVQIYMNINYIISGTGFVDMD